MKTDNRIIVELNKVQWARFYYENQHGDKRNLKPTLPTVFNRVVDQVEIHCRTKQPMIEYATKQGLLDAWTPVVVFKLTAHECLKYTGEKAVSIYKAWCERIFNKKDK